MLQCDTCGEDYSFCPQHIKDHEHVTEDDEETTDEDSDLVINKSKDDNFAIIDYSNLDMSDFDDTQKLVDAIGEFITKGYTIFENDGGEEVWMIRK